jgi:hypothetical protein
MSLREHPEQNLRGGLPGEVGFQANYYLQRNLP